MYIEYALHNINTKPSKQIHIYLGNMKMNELVSLRFAKVARLKTYKQLHNCTTEAIIFLLEILLNSASFLKSRRSMHLGGGGGVINSE